VTLRRSSKPDVQSKTCDRREWIAVVRSRARYGSAASNTSQLIDRLEAPLGLVSSSGDRHGHLSPRRLPSSCEHDAGERLVVNYKSAFNNVSSPPRLLGNVDTGRYGDNALQVAVDLV
jgi:hypothetical protein